MNRLSSELYRLYQPHASGDSDGAQGTAPDEPRLIDGRGEVRAMVLALAKPADWGLLSKVWHGVQVDLELPAPAIAVAGADGYQLWFSLAEPVPAAQALAFLEALRRRYLGDIKASRVAMMPTVAASSPLAAVHARRVPAELPAQRPDSGQWSAFVSPDLAPVFAEEPWLNSPPNPVGQSDLLSRLECMAAADFHRVLEKLRLNPLATQPKPNPAPAASADPGAEVMNDHPAPAGAWLDPKRFLLEVMNNDTIAMGLRIDAAKALLPYLDDPGLT